MSSRRHAFLPRTDWFRVLADLRAIGWTEVEVAVHLGMGRTTVRAWKMGHEPNHYDGARLLLLYQDITGRQLIPVVDPTSNGKILSR